MKIQRANRALDLWVHIDGLIQIHRVGVCVCVCSNNSGWCASESVRYGIRDRCELSRFSLSIVSNYCAYYFCQKPHTHESKHLSGTRANFDLLFLNQFHFSLSSIEMTKTNMHFTNKKGTEKEEYTHILVYTEWATEPWTMRRYCFFVFKVGICLPLPLSAIYKIDLGHLNVNLKLKHQTQ